jgi:hypothetical protein
MSLQLSSPLTNPNSEEEVNIILSGNAAQPIILELLGQASALQVSNQHQQQLLWLHPLHNHWHLQRRTQALPHHSGAYSTSTTTSTSSTTAGTTSSSSSSSYSSTTSPTSEPTSTT